MVNFIVCELYLRKTKEMHMEIKMKFLSNNVERKKYINGVL